MSQSPSNLQNNRRSPQLFYGVHGVTRPNLSAACIFVQHDLTAYPARNGADTEVAWRVQALLVVRPLNYTINIVCQRTSKLSVKSANGGAGLPIGAATNLFGKTGGAIKYDDSAKKRRICLPLLISFLLIQEHNQNAIISKKKTSGQNLKIGKWTSYQDS